MRNNTSCATRRARADDIASRTLGFRLLLHFSMPVRMSPYVCCSGTEITAHSRKVLGPICKMLLAGCHGCACAIPGRKQAGTCGEARCRRPWPQPQREPRMRAPRAACRSSA